MITVEKAPSYTDAQPAHEHLAAVEKLAAEAEAAGNTEAVAGFAIVRERLLKDIAALNAMN